MKNWFNPPSQYIEQLEHEVLTLRATVNSLVATVNTLEQEIKRRVLMSDVASLGRDVQEHGVQLEELTEAVKVLTDGQTSVSVNTLAEDKMLAQVANGASVNTTKPSTRRKTPARKGA